MEALQPFFDAFLKFGPAGVLTLIIILIIQEPDRARSIQALILTPTFNLFRWGARTFIAAKIGHTTTAFIKKSLKNHLTGIDQVDVSIKWVNSASDPILEKDGTLIMFLQEDKDQTRNILKAARIAIPHYVAPLTRSHLQPYIHSTIDLAILRRLADGLGKHARFVFQKYFADPELNKSPEAAALFQDLVEIDREGLFINIFLEELHCLGEGLYQEGNQADESEEVISLLRFLLVLARRKLNEEIPLSLHLNHINFSVILVAKSQVAQALGIAPYVKRINKNIATGCSNIYLVGYKHAKELLDDVIKATAEDERLLVTKPITRSRINSKNFNSTEVYMAMLTVNQELTHITFLERIQAAELREGELAKGQVINVATDSCTIIVNGIGCELRRREASWNVIKDCRETLKEGDTLTFKIIAINIEEERVYLSLRTDATDPYKLVTPPKVGDTIKAIVNFADEGKYFAVIDSVIEVEIPFQEASWKEHHPEIDELLIGREVSALIYEADYERHHLRGSIRQLEEDPWPAIHAQLPVGTELRAHVIKISPEGVLVRLTNDVTATLPKDALTQAGHEYADFENTMVVGQGLDVVISKVFLAKKKIRVDLRRNVRLKEPS